MADELTRREKLGQKLKELMPENDKHVYYQPPSNIQMVYPCIVYARSRSETKFADNLPYLSAKGYRVTLISHEPDHPASDKIAMLPTCTHETSYSADTLHHDVYNLFF